MGEELGTRSFPAKGMVKRVTMGRAAGSGALGCVRGGLWELLGREAQDSGSLRWAGPRSCWNLRFSGRGPWTVAGGTEARAGPELPPVRVCRRGPSVPEAPPGLPPTCGPGPGSWAGARPGPNLLLEPQRSPDERPGPFMWSPLLSTAGRHLVFHQNSPGLVSCLGDNCWFILKG